MKRIKIDVGQVQGRLSRDWEIPVDRLDVIDHFVGQGLHYDGDGWFIDCARARQVVPQGDILDCKTGPL